MKLGDLIYTQYYTNLQMLEGELNKKTTWLLLYLTPQPNLLDETGRLDSVHVGEQLHPNRTRVNRFGYNPKGQHRYLVDRVL